MIRTTKDFFEGQVKRDINRLSRGLLNAIEDLKTQQKISEDELLKSLPPQYHNLVKASNVLTEERVKLLRKRILDNTNDHSRDILAGMENFEIEFKFNSTKV